MKKIHFIIFMALVVAGCVREDAGGNFDPADNRIQARFVAMASPDIEDMETRTMLNADYSVSWHSDDAVAYISYENPSKLTNTFSDGPIAVFEGNVPEKSMTEKEHFLIYPYRESLNEEGMMRKNMANHTTGEYLVENVVLPTRQKLTRDSFDRNANISMAVSDWANEEPLMFRNLFSLMRVTMTGNAMIKRLTLSSLSPLSGTVSILHQPDKAGTAEEFIWEYQHETHGNPGIEHRVILEAAEGVRLTEEPQSFYFAVLDDRSGFVAVPLNLNVTTIEGDVFSFGRNLKIRSGKIMNWPGQIIVNANPFDLMEVSSDKEEREIQVTKSPCLEHDYEVRGTESWISTAKNELGFVLKLEPNATGAVREGRVEILDSDGNISAAIPVRQLPYGYRDFLGMYVIANSSYAMGLYLKEAEDGSDDHYVVEAFKTAEIKLKNYRPVFIMKYNGIGKSLLSLPLPQVLPDFEGLNTELFCATNSGDLCVGEGNGYDFPYTGSAGTHSFGIEPNDISRSLYSNVQELCITVGGVVREHIMITGFEGAGMMPVPGQYDGGHNGYTPI